MTFSLRMAQLAAWWAAQPLGYRDRYYNIQRTDDGARGVYARPGGCLSSTGVGTPPHLDKTRRAKEAGYVLVCVVLGARGFSVLQ